jgi:hypothetical protein
VLPRPLHPRIAQLKEILQGIFHLPISAVLSPPAYTN